MAAKSTAYAYAARSSALEECLKIIIVHIDSSFRVARMQLAQLNVGVARYMMLRADITLLRLNSVTLDVTSCSLENEGTHRICWRS